jgi:hypothetical protein
MKIKIGESTTDKKDLFYLNKKKRENILISGSIGCGIYHSILCLFSSILNDNKVDSSITVLEHYSEELTSYFYNFLDMHNLADKFELVNLTDLNENTKVKTISDYINNCLENKKHILIILPEPFNKFHEEQFKFFIDTLKNLNVRNNETPIILENISSFSLTEIKAYNNIILELNFKNYFFISRILGLKDHVFSKENLSELEYTHKHFLKLKQMNEIKKDDLYFSNIYRMMKESLFQESLNFFYFYENKNMFQIKYEIPNVEYKIPNIDISLEKDIFLKNYKTINLEQLLLKLNIINF